jgi:hypothetical protein
MGSLTSQQSENIEAVEANGKAAGAGGAMREQLTTPRGDGRSSPADRLCDGFAFFFGAWTLLANGAVFMAGSLRQLEAAFAVAGVAGVAAAAAWRQRRAGPNGEISAAEEGPAQTSSHRDDAVPALWQRLAVAVAALVSLGLYATTGRIQVLWLSAIPWLLVLCLRELISRPARTRPDAASGRDASADPRGRQALLFGLALVCSVLTLVAHRPDADDAFYVNMAVAAADHPSAPLLAGDTLHGVPGVPLPLPIYKVHSLELLAASLSHLTRLPVLSVAHLWLPAMVAFLVPLAYARLLRPLMPRAWLWGVFFAMAFLLLAGGASHGHANFAFVRLHQGKSMLLSLGLPLLMAYALEFGLAPSIGRWLRLAAAQIAAVGLSASGLWLAPAVAGLALASAGARPPRRAAIRTLLIGVAASAYPLALGLGLRADTEAAFRNAAVPVAKAALRSNTLVSETLWAGLGQDPASWLVLFAALGAWCVAPSATARRFCVLFPLAFLLLFLNPYTAPWIASHVTSGPTYWRVVWMLPIPVLVAVMLGAPLARPVWRERRWVAPCLSLSAAAVALVWAPATYTLSSVNHVRLDWPGWKVPPAAFGAARAVAERAAPGAAVLAAQEVAPWIPTLHHYPQPIVVRTIYLPLLSGHLDDQELARRVHLSRLVSGESRPAHADTMLEEAVREYPLEAVVLAREALRWSDLPRALERAGLTRVPHHEDFEVWARADPEDAQQ